MDPFGLATARCEFASRADGAGCSHPCTNVYIDGSGEPLPGDLAATEVSSGSILNAVGCATSDCEGVQFNPDGSVSGYTVTWTWSDKGGAAGWGPIKGGGFGYISNPNWGWKASISPSGFSTGCGLDPFCEAFVGWGNLFLNGDLAGALQTAAGYTGIAATGATVGAAVTFGPSAIAWTINVGLPSAYELVNELGANPIAWAAAADCAVEFIPGAGPPPDDPIGLACHAADWGIHTLWGGH